MATFIIGTIVFLAIAGVVYKTYKDKKNGNFCSGGCSGCSGACKTDNKLKFK